MHFPHNVFQDFNINTNFKRQQYKDHSEQLREYIEFKTNIFDFNLGVTLTARKFILVRGRLEGGKRAQKTKTDFYLQKKTTFNHNKMHRVEFIFNYVHTCMI